jgi:hypothetical protein
MSSAFPTFQDEYLRSFVFCSCFALSDTPLSRIVSHLDRNKEETRETRFDSTAGPVWIRVLVSRVRRSQKSGSSAVRNGHLHIDCSLESEIQPSQVKKKPPNSNKEVQDLLEMLAAEKVGRICCQGRFRIPKKVLPKRGVVALMLDIAVKVGKAQMGLIGAEFDVRNRSPYDKIKWRLEPEVDGKFNLRVDIMAYDDLKTVKGRLDRIAEVLSKGVRELITENISETGEKP